ncbi:MAG: hypothetical protein RRA94_12195, partial [Bacteroidota bacterium]|nr:hypothetical protein [Bacteroidota bacterium]
QASDAPIGQALSDALAGHEFDSMEEAQDFAARLKMAHNTQGIDDFHGLSAEQMHLLLHQPFSSPRLVEFPALLPSRPDAPVTLLYEMLRDAIGEKGLKATAKGNLPRNFCREVAEEYYRDDPDPLNQAHMRFEIHRETDFPDLEKLRLILEEGGLMKLRDGRWQLTPRCRQLEKEGGSAALYPAMLKIFATTINWAYWDGFEDLAIVQASFAWSLFLLQKEGRQVRPSSYYEDAFLKAFPAALIGLQQTPYRSPEEEATSCYRIRFLDRFAAFFGLIERSFEASGMTISNPYTLTARPLLREAVRFHV